jgi:SAM-dependent methyltransferase
MIKASEASGNATGSAAVDLAEINREVFASDEVCSWYADLEGWLDPGERASVLLAARGTRNRPILDIGVGAGRTASLLRLISDDYIGVDYSPPMVELFRRNHPGVDIRIGDARELAEFAAGRFGLVMFSNNGIDAVDRSARTQVLAEFARLVDGSGVVVFSTLNKHGCSYGETPWQWRRPGRPWRFSPATAIRLVGKLLLRPGRIVSSYRNYWRARQLTVDRGDWALGSLRTHDFGPVIHFTTLTGLRSDLAAAGLEIVALYGADGTAIGPDENDSSTDYFNIVARKA